MADLFEKEGFSNIIVEESEEQVLMRTNANSEEEGEKRKKHLL